MNWPRQTKDHSRTDCPLSPPVNGDSSEGQVGDSHLSNGSEGMSLIVKTVCGWLTGFILLYGIHIILYGHLTPGGGFTGGVIAASAFVLIVLAQGERAGSKSFSRKAASTLDSVGVLVFLGLAVLGLLLAGTFFINFFTTRESAWFTLLSGGIIPGCNIGIGLKVCSSLYLVVLVLTAVMAVQKPNRERGEP